MMFKSIEELTKSFYPSEREMELYALREFVGNESVANALVRNDVYNIKDLHDISIDELKKFRCIGPKKLEVIIELKEIIDRMLED